ncbi:HET-domain-containing protein [Mytilinidion resinicola]|uniref:HET-domain-containing protein n=1 Tax=Mytilinidion resinicola TaxID=574789 RepID=A0A6A6YPE5_9PEZI|nr:HET-domain-containing protein [Mytilinidion resinicola]KAF2810766.1 HET-domain-containing protein [Mytilinidion resinicola]
MDQNGFFAEGARQSSKKPHQDSTSVEPYSFTPSPTLFSAEDVCKSLQAIALEGPSLIFSIQHLKTSAMKKSCTLCSITYDALLFWPEGAYLFSDLCIVSLHRSGLEVKLGEKRFEICALEKISRIPKTIPRVCLMSDHTKSEESLQTANEWMIDCITNHGSLCGQTTRSIEVTYRVLDVGLGTSEMDTQITLKDIPPGVSCMYTCLSHCWGERPHFQTTRANLDNHRKSIPWKSLPKTFQEAIDFTRRLQFRYLWIDSLCIIQGDADDWNEQSTIMGTIYRNAAVTLAASASLGSREGLFRPTKTRKLCFGLESVCNQPNYKGIFVREKLKLLHTQLDHPLTTRGWVLQERLLSPRVLHFGKHEMMWECMTHSTCSCTELPRDTFWLQPKQKYQKFILDQASHSQTAKAWRDMVTDYSRMRFSYESDIFPAISGAVKVMEKTIQSRYLAGLWESTLTQDMLWTTNEPVSFCRPYVWRAPTWSWASVSNREAKSVLDAIKYRFQGTIDKMSEKARDHDHGSPLVLRTKLLSVDVSLAGPDSTGALKGSHIILQGQLIFGTTTEESESEICDINIPGRFRNLYPSHFYADYDLLADGEHQVSLKTRIACLKFLYLNAASWNQHYLFLLVLRQVDDAWERIGLLVYQQRQDLPQPAVDDWFKDAEVINDAIVKII